MAKNNVYSAYWDYQIAAGANESSGIRIPFNQREAQIKSILLDWQIINFATGKTTSFDVNKDQICECIIFKNAPEKITRTVEEGGGLFDFTSTGEAIVLTRPQQIILNSFFVINVLLASIGINNTSAAIHRHKITLVIETVEKILY